MQAVAEKLFDCDGVAGAHFQLGPTCMQKLSKNDVSHPAEPHRPQTPQELHVAIPAQELLLTVDCTSPALMKEVGTLTVDAVHDIVDGEDNPS